MKTWRMMMCVGLMCLLGIIGATSTAALTSPVYPGGMEGRNSTLVVVFGRPNEFDPVEGAAFPAVTPKGAFGEPGSLESLEGPGQPVAAVIALAALGDFPADSAVRVSTRGVVPEPGLLTIAELKVPGVPEPSGVILLLLGLIGMIGLVKYRKHGEKAGRGRTR